MGAVPTLRNRTRAGRADTFYEAVGGEETFRRLVDTFYAGVAERPGAAGDLSRGRSRPGRRAAADVPDPVLGRPDAPTRQQRGHPAAADAARAVPDRHRRARRVAARTCATRSTRSDLPPAYDQALWDYLRTAADSMRNIPG